MHHLTKRVCCIYRQRDENEPSLSLLWPVMEQGNAFSLAILEDSESPVCLDNAAAKSGQQKKWLSL
ncbi:MAG: hypothetical protein Q8R88_16450 [Desulfoprunum sp.]|nr:hypothetical protein [Desulfoprunum sp.]